jgi:hypothetical protein
MNPQFPLYIVSKARYDTRYTVKSFEAMRVDYSIIVEEQEYSKYARVIDKKKILVLDKRYQDEYETCDDLGSTMSKGSGAARNFAWDHAISRNAQWHWIVDDNIQGFCRLIRNRKIRVGDGTIFRAMEDFALRYTNVAIAGPTYRFFADGSSKDLPPFIANTRIYSCNLIRNDIPFRWRCRYNEDTDLSLRVLKAGWCTILFRAFLQNKLATQTVKGGNEEIYANGTLAKSQMLVNLHPDCATLVQRYGRWHHHVDYRRFIRTKLELKRDAKIEQGANEYGMQLESKRESVQAATKREPNFSDDVSFTSEPSDQLCLKLS